jgi:DNA-binding NarL/FixJ family response regulator
MKIIVHDSHPFACEFMSSLLRRIISTVEIHTAQSLQDLAVLMTSYKDVDVIIFDPMTQNGLQHAIVKYVKMNLENSKLILFSDGNNLTDNILTDYGVDGLVDKNSKVEDVVQFLIGILANINSKASKSSNLIHRSSSTSLAKIFPVPKLSNRQKQLIIFLSEGLSNREIAEKLEISESTVKVHFFRLFKSINVKSRGQAMVYAKNNGLCL